MSPSDHEKYKKLKAEIKKETKEEIKKTSKEKGVGSSWKNWFAPIRRTRTLDFGQNVLTTHHQGSDDPNA